MCGVNGPSIRRALPSSTLLTSVDQVDLVVRPTRWPAAGARPVLSSLNELSEERFGGDEIGGGQPLGAAAGGRGPAASGPGRHLLAPPQDGQGARRPRAPTAET